MVQDLKALGFEVQTDRAGEAFGSNRLNVHAFLEGTIPGDPTIFCAHMDTVASRKRDQACDQRRHYRHRWLHHPGRR